MRFFPTLFVRFLVPIRCFIHINMATLNGKQHKYISRHTNKEIVVEKKKMNKNKNSSIATAKKKKRQYVRNGCSHVLSFVVRFFDSISASISLFARFCSCVCLYGGGFVFLQRFYHTFYRTFYRTFYFACVCVY